jgi:NSS family neurotransmitter:Na+ symporter
MKDNVGRGRWATKSGFVLAAAGSAVGLGNLWKFPYMAGENGGAAFVLVYLVILVLIGMTVMLAELTVGRHTQLDALGAYKKLSAKWAWVGGMGVLCAFFIMAFYTVVGGWAIKYFVASLTNAVASIDFVGFITAPAEPLVYTLVFCLLTWVFVYFGIGGGIEKASKIMMPLLFIFIVIIAIRSCTLPGAGAGLDYYLNPDLSKINGGVILAAMGQVFFSLSLGMGCMITYGSYLDKDSSLTQSSWMIPGIDTAIAFLAGLAIFPAVFAFGMQPDAGPGLMFGILPQVFDKMPAGVFFASIFFLLVIFAALTSAISLLEVVTAYFVDEKSTSRGSASILGIIGIFILAIPCSLSMGPLAGVTVIPEIGAMNIPAMGFFDAFDWITSKLMLPLGGMLVCIFVGWVWGTDRALDEITGSGSRAFPLAGIWSILVKYIAPAAIFLVFLSGFGVI